MTAMSLALLDTDILSAVMRKNPLAIKRARSYLNVHRQFTFSLITRYEILRGLLAKSAVKQLTAFDKLCGTSRILPLSDPIIVEAATAIKHGLAVVTNNEDHFRRIPDLQIENWLT